MKTERVIELLKGLEGWRDFVYDDRSPWPRSEVGRAECALSAGQYKVLVTGGTATVGYGETSADFIDRYWGRRITQDEALAKMAERVPGFYRAVRDCIDADLTEHQWEAITCRAYQSGAGGFCRSTTADLLRNGDIDGAVENWRREFAHPDRSEVEIAHFLTDDEEMPVTRIYSRDECGLRAPRAITPAQGMTRGFGLHHLGEGEGPTTDLEESMAKWRWVQDFHMGPERGWNDIGYNWAVDHLGNGFEGRGSKVRNAANGGLSFRGYDANAGWSSILYLAGTDGPDLTPAAMDTIWAIAEQEGLADGDWLGHGDFLDTECPGENRWAWLHAGHPRGSAKPPDPTPNPQEESNVLAFFDGPPEINGGVFVSDGDRTWGVPHERYLLDFFFNGLYPHGGTMHVDTFFDQRDRFGNVRTRPESASGFEAFHAEGVVEINGDLCRSLAEVTASSTAVETGDPGCQ